MNIANVMYNELFDMMTRTEPEPIKHFSKILLNNSFSNIIGIGAGRMGYSLRAFMMRLSHIGFTTYFIGDTALPRIKENDIVIINSSSGETPTNILYAEQAKAAKSCIIAFTCNENSSIAKLSTYVVPIPKIKSEQLMKSVYEQYTFLLFDYIAQQFVHDYRLDIKRIEQNHSILE